jgi:hypothetical protein
VRAAEGKIYMAKSSFSFVERIEDEVRFFKTWATSR